MTSAWTFALLPRITPDNSLSLEPPAVGAQRQLCLQLADGAGQYLDLWLEIQPDNQLQLTLCPPADVATGPVLASADLDLTAAAKQNPHRIEH